MSPKREIYLVHTSTFSHRARCGSSIPNSATEFATVELGLIDKKCEAIERIITQALEAETGVSG